MRFERARPPWPRVRAGASAAFAFLILACGSGGRTPLVVYSPHGRDLLTLCARDFEALHPEIVVRWLDMGSQEVYDRIRSERANPQADVWFGGPDAIFARAARDSLLDPYQPSWASAVGPLVGADDRYFAAYLTPAVIVYAANALTAAQAPQDWDDLLAPRWKGKILMRDPLASGTMRAVFGLEIERGLTATGDTAAGFAWLRRLDAQTADYVLNGALLDQQLVRGEASVTIWDLPDILLSRREGLPLGYIFPRSGTPVIEDAIGIVRGARHRRAAEMFEEWVGTPAAELAAAREAFRLPARRDLSSDSLPAWVRDVTTALRPAPMDWGLLAERGDAWMRYWDQHVRGQGAGR